MSGQDVVRQTLEGNSNIVEVEVEYRKGNKAKFNLLPGNSSNRQAQIDRLLEMVKWEKVEEVEIEYVDGYKEEIDLETKLDAKHKSKTESAPPEETVEAAVTEAAIEETAEEATEAAIVEEPVVETKNTGEPTVHVAHDELSSAPVEIVPEATQTAAPDPEPAAAPAAAPTHHSPSAGTQSPAIRPRRRIRRRKASGKPRLRGKSRIRTNKRSITRLVRKRGVGSKKATTKSSRRRVPFRPLLFK